MKGRDIIIIGLQPWDVPIGSNCKDIAEVMCMHNRVLYVNYPIDLKTVAKNRRTPEMKKRFRFLFNRKKSLVQLRPNLWNYYPSVILFSVNWINSLRIFSFFNKINNRLFAASIKRAAKQLGFKNFLLFNDNDMFRGFYMKELLQPDTSIYYSRDFMLAVPYWKKHGKILEPQLIAKSDVCVANSVYLADYCRQYNPSSYYVGQGCDLSLYDPEKLATEHPPDLKNIPHPRIGYVGALTSFRLNLEWIRHVAHAHPEWNVVLVGPAEQDFVKGLKGLENVYFLGSKPVESLPAYIDGFDVCINPQLVNEVTIGNYPRKVDEYLAMQKPVVATNTPAMKSFAHMVYLANDQEEFLRNIKDALENDSELLQQQRRAFAETHTWENSVKEIFKAAGNVDSP